LREFNPAGRGKYAPGRRFGGQERGLVPRLIKLPWIPDERQWLDVLAVAAREPIRNRVMLALAYDTALRRRSCARCGPRTWIRAPHAAGAGAPHQEPAGTRGALPGGRWRVAGQLSQPSGGDQPGRWSAVPVGVAPQPRAAVEPVNVVEGRAAEAGVPRFCAHATRHLCLTGLARMGWELHAISAFAGHGSPESTLRCIHLSGRDLSGKLSKPMDHVRASRAEMLTRPGGPAAGATAP